MQPVNHVFDEVGRSRVRVRIGQEPTITRLVLWGRLKYAAGKSDQTNPKLNATRFPGNDTLRRYSVVTYCRLKEGNGWKA